MRILKAVTITSISTVLVLTGSPQVIAATSQSSVCSKAGASQVIKGATYICVRSGKKLLWQLAVHPTKSTPNATPTPAPIPTPASIPTPAPGFSIAIYSGDAGNTSGSGGMRSEEIPPGITTMNNSDNLKLWIYDPERPSKSLGSPGIFVQKDGGNWYEINANTSYGIFTSDFKPGKYLIDVIEPNGNSTKYSRGRYSVTVSGSGSVSIDGLLPNLSGYYSVTAILNTRRTTELANFKPTSVCQILDQSGSSTMSNAFPRATGRLATKGTIHALIIPTDFSDLPGSGNPADVYLRMAKGTHDFYYKESKQTVNFQFTTLKEYVHLNLPVNTFNLGSYNGGNPEGYFKAGVAAADPLVDFTKFDVVYVLPPPTVQGNQIAYGPAMPKNVDGNDFQTADGQFFNGAVGGADAWQPLEGADWKWMSHETGHLFGLYDWYTLDGTNPYGPWDIMSLNWSTAAIEFNAWNRYISGWLTDSQIQCTPKSELTATGKDFTVETIGIDSENSKAVMVKLSDKLMLAMEVRATAGLDHLTPEESGVLVYTVDSSIPTIKGMAQTYKRPGGRTDLTDAPLKTGDSITVQGVTIKVTGFANNVASIHLSS